MAAPAFAALCFLPFVLPICIYVAYTDLARMKITNKAVLALGAVFVFLGPFVMPSFEEYLWRLPHFGVVLVIGMVLNAIGQMGAGDAKFLAAAAPYVAVEDWRILMVLYLVVVLAAFGAHRIARATSLRKLAPDWVSWSKGKKFPMGFALGPILALYLCLATLIGA